MSNPVNCIYIQHAARQAGITAQDLRANPTQHEAHASAGHDNQRSYAKIRPGQLRLDDTTAETSALRQLSATSSPVPQSGRSSAARTAIAVGRDWRQNGGYLRGYPKSQVTFRDESPL